MRKEALVVHKIVKFYDLNIICEVIEFRGVERTIIAGLECLHFLVIIWVEDHHDYAHGLQ